MSQHILQTNYVGKLLFDSEDLNFLVKGHTIDSLDSNTLLVVKLVLEVLDVEILHFCGHFLNLLKKLVVLFVKLNFTSIDHIMHVKFIDFLQGQRHDFDQVAVFALTRILLFLCRPLIFYENQIWVKSLLQILLSIQLSLIWSAHDELFVPEFW